MDLDQFRTPTPKTPAATAEASDTTEEPTEEGWSPFCPSMPIRTEITRVRKHAEILAGRKDMTDAQRASMAKFMQKLFPLTEAEFIRLGIRDGFLPSDWRTDGGGAAE